MILLWLHSASEFSLTCKFCEQTSVRSRLYQNIRPGAQSWINDQSMWAMLTEQSNTYDMVHVCASTDKCDKCVFTFFLQPNWWSLVQLSSESYRRPRHKLFDLPAFAILNYERHPQRKDEWSKHTYPARVASPCCNESGPWLEKEGMRRIRVRAICF